MRNWIFLLLVFGMQAVFAQTPSKKLVQFSGIIINRDSNTVIPYVTLTNVSTKSRYAANYKGYFSMVVHQGDTIVFSAVGYKRDTTIIPPNLPENRYTVLIKLKQDVINLPVVHIYPWASVDEFRKEFLSMKFADDDLAIAKKNISRDDLSILAANLPRDGQEMQGFNFQNNHNNLVNKNINQRFANPLLNPFAWGALMQQILQGDKSRNSNE